MTTGTFDALCTNTQVFVNNTQTFDPVIAHIDTDSQTKATTLTITCQNSSSTANISWMVVGERKDPFIKLWDRTNKDGFLINEYNSYKNKI